MKVADLFRAIDALPRADLLYGPSPLRQLERISAELGVEVLCKHDEVSGIGFGGNKIRQLEFYLGAAQAKGADTVLITGAVQSNFVRSTAACAARLGMQAVVQLEERVSGMDESYYRSGNVLLEDLLGARRLSYPEGEDEAGADAAVNAEADRLRAAGHTPYVIPLSPTNAPLGACGYALAAREILAQDNAFDAVVVPSGSGMTHSGLLSGLRAAGCDVPVFGACVRRSAGIQRERIVGLCKRLARWLEVEPVVTDSDVQTTDAAFAPGYGKAGPRALDALCRMARSEGVFLDPVYSAKAFGSLLALIESGDVAQGQRALFIHTGGTPALFAYARELSEHFGPEA